MVGEPRQAFALARAVGKAMAELDLSPGAREGDDLLGLVARVQDHRLDRTEDAVALQL